MTNYLRKNGLDNPPVSVYSQLYGNGEKNSLNDALIGGKRNLINGHENQWKNKNSVLSDMAKYRHQENTVISTI